MIFVTGASRSGTTMLTQILDGHSAVAGLREMQYFGEFCDPRRDAPDHPVDRRDAVAKLFARQNEGILAAEGRRSADPGVQRVLDRLAPGAGAAEVFATAAAEFAARAGKQVPCEQTPRNIYYARELLDWYPRARFVHVVRDPRGVMASQKFRWRRRSLMQDPSKMSRRQQVRTWFNYHPYTVTQLWTLATRLALALEHHPRFHLLRFEDLLADPERRVRELCAFLELDFQPAMLDIEHVNSSYVATATAARGFAPGTIDSWRSKLSPDECALVNRRCASLMRRVGYEPEPAARSTLGPLKTGLRYLVHLAGAAAVNPRRLWIQGRALLAGAGRSTAGPGAPAGGSGSGAGRGTESADGSGARRVPVFGLACLDASLPDAAAYLVKCAAEGITRRVVFVNAHSMNVAARDARMRRALDDADIIYADGVGMAMAARLQGERLVHNVNGTDLFPYLCERASAEGVPLALLGAYPGVVEECRRVLSARFPDLEIAWCHHGFIDPDDCDRIIAEINASGAGILLVAMGQPRQELWIMQHGPDLRVPVVLGVGGLFDFVSGRVPRAPVGVRRLRLEWLFRLLMEPRRLGGRYVIGNPMFLARALRYAIWGEEPEDSREVTPR